MAESKRKLAAILAADVAGYSRLMGADEDGTVAALDTCRAIFTTTIESHDGRVVDTAGDSVLAVFEHSSARSAWLSSSARASGSLRRASSGAISSRSRRSRSSAWMRRPVVPA